MFGISSSFRVFCTRWNALNLSPKSKWFFCMNTKLQEICFTSDLIGSPFLRTYLFFFALHHHTNARSPSSLVVPTPAIKLLVGEYSPMLWYSVTTRVEFVRGVYTTRAEASQHFVSLEKSEMDSLINIIRKISWKFELNPSNQSTRVS